MYINEWLFLAHIIVVSACVLWGLWYSHGGLVGVICLQALLANLFVTKQIMLFGIETTCSEVFVVGGMYAINLMRIYNSDRACRRAVYTVFGALLLFALLVQFHIAYTGVDPIVSGALATICGSSMRLFVASLLAYVVSERAHLFFCSMLDQYTESIPWQVAAIVGGQVLDTVIFGVVGLYGVVDHLVSVILFSLVVKIFVVIALSPLMALARFVIPPSE